MMMLVSALSCFAASMCLFQEEKNVDREGKGEGGGRAWSLRRKINIAVGEMFISL